VDSASFANVHKLPQILSSQWQRPIALLSMAFRFTKIYPTSPSTRPLETSLTSLPTYTPQYSNDFIASYLKFLTSHLLHPFIPPTASITSSHWYPPLRAHEAELNSIAMITYFDHYIKKSTHVLLNTSTSSPVSYLPRHPTLSLVSVKATHKPPSQLAI
jgi:hypothetical protein